MSLETISIIQTFAIVTSTAIGIGALILALKAENRNRKQFQLQIDESRKLAEFSRKPILNIHINNYIDRKEVILANFGEGPANITHINFKRDDNEARNIAALFSFSDQFNWDSIWNFTEPTHYLPANKEIILAKLTAENLKSQNFEKEEVDKIMNTFYQELLNIKIHFEYKDVFDNPQPPLNYPIKIK